MRSASLFVGTALGACLLLSTSAAKGTPRRGARVTFARSPEASKCVGPTALEEDVRMRLGWNPFALKPELSAEGIFSRNGAAWEARFAIRDAGGNPLGERVLRSRDGSCASLGEAVAVALTVAIDPDAPGTRLPDAVEEPGAESGAPPRPAPAPSAPPPHRVGSLALFSIAAGGVLPEVSLGGGLEGELVVGRHFSLRLGAVVLPESRRRDFGFGLASLRGGLCAAPLAGSRGRLDLCAELWGGLFSAFLHPSPILVPNDVGTTPWAAGELALAGRVGMTGPLELVGKASLLTPFVRRQAFVEGRARPEWEQASVGFTLELGIGYRFLGF